MSIHRLLLPLAVAAALLPAATASAAPLPAGTTAIVSGAPSLTDALPAQVSHSRSSGESVSQNGRYVAFSSYSDGLIDGDDDRVQNVYVKDRATGALTHVSKRSGANGDPAHADCEDPAISDDGSRVAFSCQGPLDDADDNRTDDVYVRDLGSQTTILVSRVSNLGAVGESRSDAPSISANGEYVAFASDASKNLHPDAADGGQLVFRRHIGGGNETIVVSKREAANGGGAFIGKEPSISDDGQKVAFTSFPTVPRAQPDDTNGFSDVFVRDVPNDKLVVASRAPLAGAVGNDHSDSPALAGNGNAVAFRSDANNFDNARDSDHRSDVYWRSLTGAVNQQNTVLVGVNAAGDKSKARAPSIDDSGNVVGFVADDRLAPADANSTPDAYANNLSNNTVDLVGRADGDNGAPAGGEARSVAISGDATKAVVGSSTGRLIPGAEPRRNTVFLRDLTATPKRTYLVARPAGDDPFVNQGGFAGGSAISADGRFIAFVTETGALGLPDAAARGVVVRDRVTGSVTFASRADGPDGAPLDESGQTPAISADGRRVAFFVREGPDRGVWVRDIVENRTFLASRANGPGGAAANAQASSPSLDADGSRVAFVTAATNLGDGDTDATPDVHLRDLETDQTQLVSQANGVNGAKANGQSSTVDLSADGFHAAFVSAATNLGDGDTDAQIDVHLRDLSAQTTRLVSAAQDGTPSNGPDFYVTIDASGTKVAFATTAANLGVPQGGSQVFVRDLAADTLVLASRADGADGAPSNKFVQSAALSPDGGYVAFASTADNLIAGLPPVTQAYRRDLAAGRTELVSRSTAGKPAARPNVTVEDISAGGGCVSFRASDAFYGPETDYVHSYLRVFRDDCAPGDGQPGGGGGPGGGGEGPGGGGAADKTAPVLSRAKLSRKRFAVGRKATPVAAAAKQGTVLSFRSSEAGTLRITFERALPKRRFRRAGAVTRGVKAGSGKVALSGRLGRKAMAAGTYRATLVATDAAGNRSKPVVVKFTIVKGR